MGMGMGLGLGLGMGSGKMLKSSDYLHRNAMRSCLRIATLGGKFPLETLPSVSIMFQS